MQRHSRGEQQSGETINSAHTCLTAQTDPSGKGITTEVGTQLPRTDHTLGVTPGASHLLSLSLMAIW